MVDIGSLASRIDREFSAIEEKVTKARIEQAEGQKQRQQRLEQLNKAFDQLSKEVARPRLELLLKKFEGRVQALPRIVPSTREMMFEFDSRKFRVRLKFSGLTDRDVHKLVLAYDLEIIPVLMRFKQHDEMEFPLDKVDPEAAAKWFDDRILDFVQTYFSLGEDDLHVKDGAAAK